VEVLSALAWIRPEDDTMLDWAAAKDLAALDEYSKENLHLNLG